MLSETMERQLRSALDEAYERGYRAGQEDMRQRAVGLAREKIRLWKGAGCREGYSAAADMMSEDLARLDIQEAPDA